MYVAIGHNTRIIYAVGQTKEQVHRDLIELYPSFIYQASERFLSRTSVKDPLYKEPLRILKQSI